MFRELLGYVVKQILDGDEVGRGIEGVRGLRMKEEKIVR